MACNVDVPIDLISVVLAKVGTRFSSTEFKKQRAPCLRRATAHFSQWQLPFKAAIPKKNRRYPALAFVFAGAFFAVLFFAAAFFLPLAGAFAARSSIS